MTKKASDKIKFINFDIIYLQHLYIGTPGACSWIIGDAASRLDIPLLAELHKAIPTYWDLQSLIETTKKHPKRNYLVSCRLDDFLINATSDKKTLQLFAVKVALMSIARKQQWAVCNRRFFVSRLAGFRNSVSEETLLQDKSYNWERLLVKTSKLWRVLKQKLVKEHGFSFFTPVGCRGFIFGLMPADELERKYNDWLNERNVTDEQRKAIMERLGIPNDKPKAS